MSPEVAGGLVIVAAVVLVPVSLAYAIARWHTRATDRSIARIEADRALRLGEPLVVHPVDPRTAALADEYDRELYRRVVARGRP